jgi:hypothetical protein
MDIYWFEGQMDTGWVDIGKRVELLAKGSYQPITSGTVLIRASLAVGRVMDV